jgi:vacuolar-type H+-ATPase subunit F/Vma7
MRLIMMGSDELCEGFALLGFETFPNATTKNVEELLSELVKNQEKALVFLENNLSQQPGAAFLHARSESDRIIITEIPSLNAPNTYRPSVEILIARILGTAALDKPFSEESPTV